MSWADDDATPWDLGGDDTTDQPVGEGGERGETTEDGEAAPTRPVLHLEKIDPPHYDHHWVKPLILGYAYLYDYRQFYYNDYIDYMDKRSRGISREVPRPMEWTERVMRMYNAKNIEPSHKTSSNMKYITGIDLTPRHYSYHTRAYYSLKYQKIL